MEQYIISVIAVGIIGSIVSVLSPEGEGGGIKKYVNLIIGLSVTLVCISPITSALDFINNLDLNTQVSDDSEVKYEYESIFNSSYTAAEVYNLKVGIKSALCDKFSISDDECEISVTLDDKGELRRVLVTLYGSAIWRDGDEIEEYLTSLLGCEIWVAVG